LIKWKIIKLTEIWQYLCPEDQEMEKNFISKLQASQGYLRTCLPSKLKYESDSKSKWGECELPETVSADIYLPQIFNQKILLLEALIKIND